jgi:serine/threonine protein phosphatase PrpC
MTSKSHRKLAVSRAIGDMSLKPYVTSTPDVIDHELKSNDSFLVVASDGIWVSIWIVS